MQPATLGSVGIARPNFASAAPSAPIAARPVFQVIRRNGSVTPFDAGKISVAMTKAFLAVEGDSAAASRRVHDRVAELAAQVAAAVTRRLQDGGACHIEDIQDQVELALMPAGEHEVGRAYNVDRDARRQARAARSPAPAAPAAPRVKTRDGTLVPLDVSRLERVVRESCAGLADVAAQPIID